MRNSKLRLGTVQRPYRASKKRADGLKRCASKKRRRVLNLFYVRLRPVFSKWSVAEYLKPQRKLQKANREWHSSPGLAEWTESECLNLSGTSRWRKKAYWSFYVFVRPVCQKRKRCCVVQVAGVMKKVKSKLPDVQMSWKTERKRVFELKCCELVKRVNFLIWFHV